MCKAQASPSKQARLGLSLLVLLLHLRWAASDSAHLSLAQILVPVLTTGGGPAELDPVSFSPNNRGGSRYRPTARLAGLSGAGRFGERTTGRRVDKPTVWSQPDPRKSYSLPLNLVELAKSKRLSGYGAFKRSSGEKSDLQEQLKSTTSEDHQVMADNELGRQQWDDAKRQVRQQQPGGMALAVIRYVPVLMPLPAAASGSEQLLKPPARRPELYYSAGANYPSSKFQPELALAWNELSEQQHQQQDHLLQSVASSQPPIYLAGQHPPSSSKALSSYASRLMSMLRPSALLSSIQGGPAQTVQQTGAPAAQIYLLAPLDSSQQRPAASSSSTTPAPVSSGSVRPADLLLNQASRHSSIRAGARLAFQQPQHSGLICVHSFGLSAPAGMEAPPVVAAAAAAAATTTVSPQFATKQQQQQQEEVGFEYTPTTRRPALSRLSSRKESPVRLAKQRQQLANKYSSGGQQPADSQVALEEAQQRLLSLSSDENRARVSMNRTMIPFTIRDKIDSPSASNPTVQYDEPADGEPQVGDQLQDIHETKAGKAEARRSKTSFVQAARKTRKGARQKKPEENIDYRNEPAARDSGYTLPLLIASSSSAREQPRAAEQIGTAASSEVTTSSTVDGQPVSLASGRLVLVSSSSMRANEPATSKPAKPANQTVELVVDAEAPSSSNKTGNESRRESAPVNGSHSPVANENSFSFDQQLSSVDSSMDEFGRISESLQTRAMDLIDLQNSRSTFELPSQLESLSMFLAPTHQQPAITNTKRQSKATSTVLVSGRGRQRRARQAMLVRSRSEEPNKH